MKTKHVFTTQKMVMIAMLSALSYVLMLIHFPIKYLGFLELELSDIPAIVSGLAYGPVTAVIIELIKNLIKLITNTTTGGVGEVANFIISSSFMFVACGLYKALNMQGKCVISFAAGTIAMTIVGGLLNYFVLIPLYASFMGGVENVVALGTATLPIIHNATDLVVIGISPFNVFKGICISIIGYYIYKIFQKVF